MGFSSILRNFHHDRLESARDDYALVISDRKWPLKKRPVIAHIKARSKHSFLTINRNDLLHTNYTLITH